MNLLERLFTHRQTTLSGIAIAILTTLVAVGSNPPPTHRWLYSVGIAAGYLLSAIKGVSLDPGKPRPDSEPTMSRNWSGRPGFVIVAAVLVFSAVACDKQERAIAVNLDRIADAVKDGRQVRDDLYAQKIISRDTAFKLTTGLEKVNNSARVLRERAISFKASGGVTPEGKAELGTLAGEISTAVTQLVNDGTVGIQDEKARAKVLAVTGLLNQIVQRIILAVEQVKTKNPGKATAYVQLEQVPVQRSMDLTALLMWLISGINMVSAWVAAEAKRRGMTVDELLDASGVKLDENARALIADKAKYAPTEETPGLSQVE